jgi:mRNA-degrading endonuclease RelE of RelBE toxin-antitoxin system
MTLLDQIQQQLKQLPPEKQSEVLDFVAFLQQRSASGQPVAGRSLAEHPAFGSWRGRKIDALRYQRDLRAEWDARP